MRRKFYLMLSASVKSVSKLPKWRTHVIIDLFFARAETTLRRCCVFIVLYFISCSEINLPPRFAMCGWFPLFPILTQETQRRVITNQKEWWRKGAATYIC